MAKAKEFTVTIEDKPCAPGRCWLALAERGVNVPAFQSYVEEGETLARLGADDSAGAQAVPGSLPRIFDETDVAVARLPDRPGEPGRAPGAVSTRRHRDCRRVAAGHRGKPLAWLRKDWSS